MACGSGRNGLYLIENNIPVVFADIKQASLEQVAKSLENTVNPEKADLAKRWQVDFEQQNSTPLANKSFAVVLVFRYLHRPLMGQIKNTVKPGGIVIYETFSTEQVEFGRPKNPDFLLKQNELLQHFSGWEILHHFQGVVVNGAGDGKQAIAQIVARKPLPQV